MHGHQSKHFYSLRWPIGIFHNSLTDVRKVCKFVGANSFWKCKTTMWQAFELLGGGSVVFGNEKHITFTFPKSVDLNKFSNVLFSFGFSITYETSESEYVNFVTLITNIRPPTKYVSNIILQLTVTNMARMRSLNDTQPEASRIWVQLFFKQ